MQQARNIDEEDEGRRKRRKRLEDDESSSSDYDSNDGDRAKRKGRSGKEVVKGFNESELRRFLKSLKKFGKPLERLFFKFLFMKGFEIFYCYEK